MCSTLVPEPIAPEYQRFMDENDIQHFQVHIPANKGRIQINACEMTRALEIVLDKRNHPMLIHCNKGKVHTSFPLPPVSSSDYLRSTAPAASLDASAAFKVSHPPSPFPATLRKLLSQRLT